MKSRLIAALAVSVLVLGGCSKKQEAPPVSQGPVAPVPPPAGKSWTDIVQETPDGGMRMGNPDAPVKLVEYASFTCPHCRDFTAEAAEKLKSDYIASGKVSWEFRSFLLHGQDVMATLLVQCRGPQTFFPLAEQVFAAQDEWIGKLMKLSPDEQKRIAALPPEEQFKATAKASDLDGFMKARGLPAAQADACLSDKKAMDKLTAMRDKAVSDGVNGTPTFFINGKIQDEVYTWPALEPKLKAAIG